MYLYLVAIAWIYVVLLMSLTEQSVVAGVMTFLLYCVVPLSIILYVMGTPRRKQKRESKEKLLRQLPLDNAEMQKSELPTDSTK